MIIVVDIDDTLADTSHREHLIGSEGWDAFHAAGKDDPPIEPMCRLMATLMDASAEIIALTARPAKFRRMTLDWLIANGIYIDDIVMRPDDDYSSSKDLKIKLAKKYFGERFSDISLIIDDREDVLAAFRAEGITCLQVMK